MTAVTDYVSYLRDLGFVRHAGVAVNHWAKLELPSIQIGNGHAAAVTFAVIDVEKEQEYGNDSYGSKVIVMPFDGAAMDSDWGRASK